MEIYLPKQNVIFDATVLSALQGCERYMDLRFNMNYIPIGGTGNALEVGSLVHMILQEYNRALIAGQTRTNAIIIGMQAGEEFYKTSENIPMENEKDKQSKLKIVGYSWAIETMNQYFEKWKNDHWTPISAERVAGEVIYEDDEIRILYKAKLDLTVDTYQDGIMPVDYKTMKQKRDVLSLNNQFMGQCILAKSRKMCIEKIGWQQTLKPEEKFTRQIMSYSADRLAEQIETIAYYGKHMVQLNNQNYFPPRFSHCDKWGGCMYRGICESDRGMREEELKLHFKVGESWDPSNDIEVD